MVYGVYGVLEIEVQPASMRYGFPKARIVEGDEMVEGLQEFEKPLTFVCFATAFMGSMCSI